MPLLISYLGDPANSLDSKQDDATDRPTTAEFSVNLYLGKNLRIGRTVHFALQDCIVCFSPRCMPPMLKLQCMCLIYIYRMLLW